MISCLNKGPLTYFRAINIVLCLLELFGAFIFFKQISDEIIIGIFILESIKNAILIFDKKGRKFSQKPRKHISLNDYNKQAIEYTNQQLKELKRYFESSECDKWKLFINVSRGLR